MLVVTYSDFSKNMNSYLETAKMSGIKILPAKKSFSFFKRRRAEKLQKSIAEVTGIVPEDEDCTKLKEEALLN